MRRSRTVGTPLGECRDCGLPIRWVRLDTGKPMPVNPGENPAGTVAAWKTGGGGLAGHVISRTRPAEARAFRFTPHAATCPALDRTPAAKPAPDPALF